MAEATTTRKVDYFRMPRPLWRKLKKYLPKRRRRKSAKGGWGASQSHSVSEVIADKKDGTFQKKYTSGKGRLSLFD